jgi:hypothetical protein
MLPQATKVPAEKNDMNRDKPPINHGTDSPPAKNVLMLLPFRENNIPTPNTNTENKVITAVSK